MNFDRMDKAVGSAILALERPTGFGVELLNALTDLKKQAAQAPQQDVVSEALLPPGTWMSMTYKRRSKNRWEWLGKIQNDRRCAPSGRGLYRSSPVELVCELPAIWLERYAKEFGIG